LQSYPVLYDIHQIKGSSGWTISFFVPGDPGTNYQVEFYANDSPDAAGLSEGATFLGSFSAPGDQPVTTPALNPGNLVTQYITGVAIDPGGNTSEFSPCRDVLRNSVTQDTVTPVEQGRLRVIFQPTINLGGWPLTLARAAQICDVDHFNWVQYVTGLPVNDMPFAYTGTAFPPPLEATVPLTFPFPDPAVSPQQYEDIAVDPTQPSGLLHVDFPADPPNDQYLYYYNETATDPLHDPIPEINSVTTPNMLIFSDRPGLEPVFYDLPSISGRPRMVGGVMSFRTLLAGVRVDASHDHTPVEWVGITHTFLWTSNGKLGEPPPGGLPPTLPGTGIQSFDFEDQALPGTGAPAPGPEIDGSTAPVSGPAPSANQLFVAQLSRDLFGQQADPATLAAWTSFLDQGGSPLQLVLQLERLPAFRQRLVRLLYHDLLHRDVRPAELTRGQDYLAEGHTLGQLEGLILQRNGVPPDRALRTRNDPAVQQALVRDLTRLLDLSPDAKALARFTRRRQQGASLEQLLAPLVVATVVEQLTV
jgi:hypothetical protein